MRVAAVVLADGVARRSGRSASKALLAIEGEPIIRRAVRRALRAGASPVIVVVGHEAPQVRAAVADLECKCVVIPPVRSARALHAALPLLGRDCDAMLVMDGSIPRVSERMLVALVGAARRSPAPLVVSRYGDHTAPPLLFRRALFAELLASNGDGACKPVVQHHRNDAMYLDWAPSVLASVGGPRKQRPVRARAMKK
ncbi:MAG TPA: NTP transferase domain-containing protein [Gemmatimonadales bacterium]|nr:NTP transferase domain-containing protein [Gemmatimonadales bacterium]